MKKVARSLYADADSIFKTALKAMVSPEYLEDEQRFVKAVIELWHSNRDNTLPIAPELHIQKANDLFQLYSAMHEFIQAHPMANINYVDVYVSLRQGNLDQAWAVFITEKRSVMSVLSKVRDTQNRREAFR
ncbi:hypothetical protein [Enterovibrio norvegicus]|uniref:hypothetical protein n=1 Tax=Enterovibrio norvegicus TaxID=188144 RepID=UPI00352E9049